MQKLQLKMDLIWRIVFSEFAVVIFIILNLRVLLLNTFLFFVLSGGLPLWSAEVASDENIKQLTVNNYLQDAKAKGLQSNNLINESSPYLLQHAYNPVKWYPWGEEAFKKAKKENKPILLSIGYSTCHWCHIMAHESFENKKIAALINKYFVAIKVDREQRPDIDAVYMSATQLINGQGGWPMTVFLDHRLRPFHAATYYPPFSVDDRLGLQEVLLKINELWTEERKVIDGVATSVTDQITRMSDETTEGGELSKNIYQQAMIQIAGRFDEETGGFSAAPKFPQPGIFYFLNGLANGGGTTEANTEENTSISTVVKMTMSKVVTDDAKKMMQVTLDAMASGGIYDQAAGGFHRYSVDANWQVPHFEKMLYSQALMVMAYNDFCRIEVPDGDEEKLEVKKRYKKIIYQTLGFVKQEMRSPQGGYYSALDADSERIDTKGRNTGEHAEGAYYLWSETELKQLLSKDEFGFVKRYFNLSEQGNIFSDPQNEFTDLNILYVDEEYRNQKLSKQQESWLASVKKKLNEQRRLRPRPHLDDKVITAWNGILLSAFAQASIVFDDKTLLADAIQILRYVKKHLYSSDTNRFGANNLGSKKLYRQYRDIGNDDIAMSRNLQNDVRIEAILADYVWLIDGLLHVYESGKDKQWLDWAMVLQKKQDDLFLDLTTGAYFEATGNDTNLLFRSKSIFDGALPSANAIALSNLRRLSVLLKKESNKKEFSNQANMFFNQANKLVSSFATAVNQNPSAAAMFLAVELKPYHLNQKIEK